MKKLFSIPFLFLIFILNPIYSQSDSILQKEIDDQIWYPFINAYNNWNAEAFNSIHDKDMLRGSPWGLKTGEEYFKRNLERFEKGKSSGNERNISFTFECRVHEKDMAYEVGYYKLIDKREDKENVYYGQFHVVLEKINGKWKIVQDWDMDKLNGEKIGEEHFMKFAENGIYGR